VCADQPPSEGGRRLLRCGDICAGGGGNISAMPPGDAGALREVDEHTERGVEEDVRRRIGQEYLGYAQP
jgi:hypothetical protein